MSLRTHLVLAFGMVAAVPLVGGALGILAQRTALARMEAAVVAADLGPQVQERWRERSQAVREAANVHSALLGAGTLMGVVIAGVFGVYTSNVIVRHLRTVVGRMEERTLSVASTAERVAGSSTSLASSCSDQAAKLEASSAAMAEVQVTVQQNADRARGVEHATRDNRAAVERSVAALGEMTAAMREISVANRKIGEIVKSIDGIAFQTNLLALNAAVEAARAGEAGAGFSVVAGEVRELARRTALEARDTTTRIEEAVSRAARGAELSERVSQEISVLVQNAERMDGLISQIALASREQATAVGGVLQNLTSVDQLTQENAGISEETAAAAEILRQQVQGLKSELGQVLASDRAARDAAPVLVASALAAG